MSYPNDHMYIIVSLILDPLDLNVDQFENGTKNEESTYTVRYGISKNPNYSIFNTYFLIRKSKCYHQC